jgi:hypothetical protein
MRAFAGEKVDYLGRDEMVVQVDDSHDVPQAMPVSLQDEAGLVTE